MIDQKDNSLLPCPFCGAPAEWEYTPWNDEHETGDDGSGWIECTGCHVQMPCGCRDEADDRWNKRVVAEKTQPPLAWYDPTTRQASADKDSLPRGAQIWPLFPH